VSPTTRTAFTVAYRYLLTVDTDYDPPEVSIEVFEDFAAHERARKAAAKRERELAKAALAAKAKQEQERLAEAEQERQEHLAELSRLLDAAKRLVVAAEALSASGVASMMEHVEQRALVTEADRQVKAVAAYATTYGLIVPAELAHLVARVGPIKRRVGA
jgi:hypothetical protein